MNATAMPWKAAVTAAIVLATCGCASRAPSVRTPAYSPSVVSESGFVQTDSSGPLLLGLLVVAPQPDAEPPARQAYQPCNCACGR